MLEILDELELDHEIQRAMKATQTPGLALAIVRGQEILYATDGRNVTVTTNKGQLCIAFHWNQQTFVLQPLSETCFVFSSGLIEFQIKESSQPVLNFRGTSLGIRSNSSQAIL